MEFHSTVCQQRFSTVNGLPCEHKIEILSKSAVSIPLAAIHPHWRLYKHGERSEAERVETVPFFDVLFNDLVERLRETLHELPAHSRPNLISDLEKVLERRDWEERIGVREPDSMNDGGRKKKVPLTVARSKKRLAEYEKSGGRILSSWEDGVEVNTTTNSSDINVQNRLLPLPFHTIHRTPSLPSYPLISTPVSVPVLAQKRSYDCVKNNGAGGGIALKRTVEGEVELERQMDEIYRGNTRNLPIELLEKSPEKKRYRY